MSTLCEICYSYTGVQNYHSKECCPLIPSLQCRRCHCQGHTSDQCGESWGNWERPTSLEELIPPDVRARWRITTHTSLNFPQPRGTEKTDSELRYEVVVTNDDKKIRAFMAENNIKTRASKEENLKIIRDWAIQRTYRLRILKA